MSSTKISFSLDLTTTPEKLLDRKESELKKGIDFGDGVELIQSFQVIQRLSDDAPWTFFFDIIMPSIVSGTASGSVSASVRWIFEQIQKSKEKGTICLNGHRLTFESGQFKNKLELTIPAEATEIAIKFKDGQLEDISVKSRHS
jgi:hypothetical protein